MFGVGMMGHTVEKGGQVLEEKGGSARTRGSVRHLRGHNGKEDNRRGPESVGTSGDAMCSVAPPGGEAAGRAVGGPRSTEHLNLGEMAGHRVVLGTGCGGHL